MEYLLSAILAMTILSLAAAEDMREAYMWHLDYLPAQVTVTVTLTRDQALAAVNRGGIYLVACRGQEGTGQNHWTENAVVREITVPPAGGVTRVVMMVPMYASEGTNGDPRVIVAFSHIPQHPVYSQPGEMWLTKWEMVNEFETTCGFPQVAVE